MISYLKDTSVVFILSDLHKTKRKPALYFRVLHKDLRDTQHVGVKPSWLSPIPLPIEKEWAPNKEPILLSLP